MFDEGTEMPSDLFLGVPKPDVALESRSAEEGNPGGGRTLETRVSSVLIESGHGLVGRVDVDLFTGPKPTGAFNEPSESRVQVEAHFCSSRPRAGSATSELPPSPPRRLSGTSAL